MCNDYKEKSKCETTERIKLPKHENIKRQVEKENDFEY